jgi:hypothetical protein
VKLRFASVTHPEGPRSVVVVLPDDLIGTPVGLTDPRGNQQAARAGDAPEYGAAAVEFSTNRADSYVLSVPDSSYRAHVPCPVTFPSKGTLVRLEVALPVGPAHLPAPVSGPLSEDDALDLFLSKLDEALEVLRISRGSREEV